MSKKRLDRYGQTHTVYMKQRRKVLMTQDVCALCGRPVDKTLPQTDPYCAQVDHIIPLAKGGHPTDIGNLQLTHAICNRLKSDRIVADGYTTAKKETSEFLQVRDWSNF